jgi:hypothetical protein
MRGHRESTSKNPSCFVDKLTMSLNMGATTPHFC